MTFSEKKIIEFFGGTAGQNCCRKFRKSFVRIPKESSVRIFRESSGRFPGVALKRTLEGNLSAIPGGTSS